MDSHGEGFGRHARGGINGLLKTASPDGDAGNANAASLDGMTKTELLAYAGKLGLPGVSSSMTKAQIMEAITEWQSQ